MDQVQQVENHQNTPFPHVEKIIFYQSESQNQIKIEFDHPLVVDWCFDNPPDPLQFIKFKVEGIKNEKIECQPLFMSKDTKNCIFNVNFESDVECLIYLYSETRFLLCCPIRLFIKKQYFLKPSQICPKSVQLHDQWFNVLKLSPHPGTIKSSLPHSNPQDLIFKTNIFCMNG